MHTFFLLIKHLKIVKQKVIIKKVCIGYFSIHKIVTVALHMNIVIIYKKLSLYIQK